MIMVLFLSLADSVGQEPLYPYMAGQRFGYCTHDKKMVIPPVYWKTESNNNFYVCHDTMGITIVFNSNGVRIDSAYDVYNVGTSRTLFVAPCSVAAMKEHIKGHVNRRYQEWEYFTPSTAWTIDSTGHRAPIADTIMAISDEHKWLELRNGDRNGIYDVAQSRYVVPMTTDSLQIVEHKFFLVRGAGHCIAYTEDGKKYTVPPTVAELGNIYNDGGYFESSFMPERRKAIYDSNGTLVMPPEKYWEALTNEENRIIGFYVFVKDKALHTFAPYELYNGKGEYVKDIYYLERGRARGNCQLISMYDTTDRNSPLKYLYDMVANTWQLIDMAPTPNKRRPTWEYVKSDGQFITVNDAGGVAYYSAYTGTLVFTIRDSVWSKRFNKQVIGTISSGRNTTPLPPYFYRETIDGPLTLVDPVYNTINNDYDSIVSLEMYFPRYFLVKKGRKWGLMNGDLKEMVPAIYDHIDLPRPRRYCYENNSFDASLPYLHVTIGAASYWVDTNGTTLFGGINYSAVANYSVGGQWLAYSYKELTSHIDKSYKYTVVEKVHLIDKDGKILASWKGSDSIGYNYIITVNGKILRYCNGEKATMPNFQLFDPQTGKTDTLHARFKEVRTFHNAALLIICEDTGRHPGVFSALDFAKVLPYGHYEEAEIRTTEVTSAMAGKESGLMLEVPEKDNNPGPEGDHPYLKRPLHLYGGFYSVSGIKFWDPRIKY